MSDTKDVKNKDEEEKKLVLRYDPNTIEHLGISLYSKLPSVLSELISNSWDADSNNITIDFVTNTGSRAIEYTDDGEGMTFDELNDKYLRIGRNRRKDTDRQISTQGRPVIGKKGLGKLAVFGICDEVEVCSVKNGVKNHFVMNLNTIKASDGEYSPDIIITNSPVSEPDGTIIKLKKLRRKSAIILKDIALSLSKKFSIFDKMNVNLMENSNSETTISISNELKFDTLNTQFTWDFPDKKYDSKYEHWKSVGGKIITLDTPVKDTEMRGIYLISRGKIVNEASFYGLRDNDQFHSYVTGYLEVDFIDDFDDDVISTDRHSLIWENDETDKLKDYLQSVIKKIGVEWKNKRREKKEKQLNTGENKLNLPEWQSKLPSHERELSHKIIDPILEDSNIDVTKAASLINHVIDKFDNKSFKDYASDIAGISDSTQIPKLIELMDEWKSVESKHYSDLARSRVEVIKKFEEYIVTDTKEVPVLHNFLKKFSWLLDPRILEFKDEVTYSSLLKENFPEEGLEESDRRIDFLCSNALGEIMYVIEIKRSTYKIDVKALEQTYHYGQFLKRKYASHQAGFSKVVCFVVGGEKKANDYMFEAKEETYMKSGEVFVKTYRELLEQSKEYHKEFFEAYDIHNN
ncbi:ATP-binding protein [Vibrio splendidus]